MGSAKTPQEPPADRLSTSDKQGRRIFLYPAEVKGWFHSRRAVAQALLIAVFLVLPWVKLNGNPLILLDIAHRRFTVFGLMFWAHDAPMLFFVFGGAALALGLATALWGRVWCGWACPQTVFIEGVFRRIERWVEGDHLARRKLDSSPWSRAKISKKAMKWIAFATISAAIAHSFLAYFVGTQALAQMVRRSPAESPMSFLAMLFVASGILFDFGWFREQFCTVLCPYGRFQSLLMDEHSMQVAYDARRGDCVDCLRCVRVCPTGIDIRQGSQLECVGCTACMDACDDVMGRLRKPKGLIRYDSVEGLSGRPRRWLRPRVIGYALVLSAFISGLTATLLLRQAVDATIVRAADAPYEVVGEEVINRFRVELSNNDFEEQQLRLSPSAPDRERGVSFVTAEPVLRLEAGKKLTADLFARFPKRLLSMGRAAINLEILDSRGPIRQEEIHLVGPFQ